MVHNVCQVVVGGGDGGAGGHVCVCVYVCVNMYVCTGQGNN